MSNNDGNQNMQGSSSRGGDRYPVFDPFGLPAEAEDMSGEAEFSLDGDFTYRSVDILPMPSLNRVELRRPEPMSAPFSMGLGSLPKPMLTSSVASAKTPAMTLSPPEVVVVPKAPAPASSAPKQLEAPSLPLDISIFPLEKCHFFTEKKPQDACRGIEEALDALNVVYEFNADKCKYTCEYMSGYNLVKFVARIYKAGPAVGSDHSYVVEFQRRQGCCLVCGKLLDQIRTLLFPMEATTTKGRGDDKPEAFLPCLTEALVFKQVELAPDQVQKEVEKLQSCLVCKGTNDSQKEMSKVLIPLSQTCPQYLCRDRKLVSLVNELAGNCSDEVRLSAISCIANMAAAYKEGQETAWFPQTMRPVVLALASDRNPHVRREAARALMYISGKHSQAKAIVRLGGLETLKKFAEGHQDRLLGGYCASAVHNIVSVC